jgi:hypothetical protein
MSLLAIIPARGGSKGLPGKNIRPLGGKPLLAYSIEAALSCRHVDRVIVSTESQQIADIATRYGAEVPFLRTAELAGDKANLGQVVNEVLWRLAHGGHAPDMHITLLPTSPFRTLGLMDHLCGLLVRGHKTVQTVKLIRPNALFTQGPGGALHPVAAGEPVDNSAPVFRGYGIFTGHNPFGDLPAVMHPVSDPVMLIDIDRQTDFELAEAVLRGQAFSFSAAETEHG